MIVILIIMGENHSLTVLFHIPPEYNHGMVFKRMIDILIRGGYYAFVFAVCMPWRVESDI